MYYRVNMTFTYFKQTSPLFKDFPGSLIDKDEMLYLCRGKKKKALAIPFILGLEAFYIALSVRKDAEI